MLPFDDLLDAPLVLGIPIGMEEQDGDRLHARGDGLGDHRTDLILVERDQHPPLGVDPLTHLETPRPLNQRLMLAEKQIVGFGPIDAAYLVYVAEALRRQQRAGGAGTLEDGVDRNRRAVEKKPRRREGSARLDDAALDAVDKPRRRRQRLAEPQLSSRLVESGNIGESPADIGGQADAAAGRRVDFHQERSLRWKR